MKYGLIGEKLAHSFSAEIHTRFFGYDYALKELSPSQLGDFLTKREFDAINVTAPYKVAVMPHLDEVDEVARQIGAVNTIVNRGGKLYGYNTDYDGLCALVERSGVVLADKRVLILGSGGTSKTAMAVAKRYGCASVVRVSRTAREDCVTYEQAYCAHRDAQILINTTPCGMYPNSSDMPVDLDGFPALEGVIDVVYNPLRTRLVCDAQSRGLKTVGGLYMLVAQAVSASEKFTDRSISRERVDEIYRHLKMEKENVVLIGMPGCGKTTVGKQLAAMLGKSFVDTDAWIADKKRCSVPDLLREIGEEAFREIEAEVICETASVKGAVIATGGGAVLRRDNIKHLKQNGRICFLDRELDLLTVSTERPLTATAEALQQRYVERYPIYSAVCDVKIKANGTPQEVANLLREDFLYEHFGN